MFCLDIDENVSTDLSLQLDSIASIFHLYLSLPFMVVFCSCQNARVETCGRLSAASVIAGL